jgi:hypothetical protein
MIITTGGCPRCGSAIFRDDDGQYCLCGWRPRTTGIIVIPRRRRYTPAPLEVYVEANRSAIIRDYMVGCLRNARICARWGMTFALWRRKKREWHLHKG